MLMLLASRPISDSNQKNPPNIIFIMADDLGYGDLGCYGQKIIKTPHLDQMATEGMRFTQCYAGSPVCAPSRSVLMTGQHTGHTTVRGNFGRGGVTGLGGGAGRIPLSTEDTTVAEVLQAVGYKTGMVGKWGLGEPNTSGLPNQQGFDEFFGFLNQRRAHTYFPEYIWRNEEKIMLAGNKDHQQKEYVHDLFTNEAIDFIKRNKKTAFFLYLPYTIPHDDYEVPDLGSFADSTHWTENERVYAAMVERMDGDVGRIMETLKKEGIDDNTIVFFCSDNGAAQRWDSRFDSSGALRGRKRDLYEGGIRTPMIVRFPHKIPAGKVSDTPWYFADVLPTIAALAHAPTPVNIDGVDVSKNLFSENAEIADRSFYWEFYEGGFQQAVRWGDWKGVLPSLESNWEIYDLKTDPAELNNVAEKHPEVAAQIAEIAQREHVPSPFFNIIKRDKRKAKLFVIGDSTVKNGKSENGLYGWGDLLTPFFDTTKIEIENFARGGRSSRTFMTEGLWANVESQLQPGDYVLMQFGHNDGGPLDSGRARGSLKGIGDETQQITIEDTDRHEVVHTFGWYMKKMIEATKNKGVMPIVLSPVPRDKWEGDRVVRAEGDYGKWAAEVAALEGVPFLPLNDIVVEKYEAIGKEKVRESFFPGDHTHTNEAGAQLNAESVIEGLRALPGKGLKAYLLDNGK